MFHLLLDNRERGGDCQHGNEAGEQNVQNAQSIHAHVVFNAPGGNPANAVYKLQTGFALVVQGKYNNRGNKGDNGSAKGNTLDTLIIFFFVLQQNPDDAEQRQEGDNC